MHIAVNLGVQKLASFQVDNLLPEEIDHEINMAVRRFINQRYSPQSNPKRRGFEQSQKRIDDLRTLLEDYHVPMFKQSRDRELYSSSGSSFGVVYTAPAGGGPIRLERFKIPIDYMYLINIKADVAKTCNSPLTFGNSFIQDAFLRIKASAPKPGMVVRRIKTPTDTGDQFDVIFETTGNSNNMEELLNPAYYAKGFEPSLSNNDGLSDMFDPSIISDSPHADSSEFYLKYPVEGGSDVTNDGIVESFANINVGTGTEGAELDGVYATVEYDYPFTDLDTVAGAEGTEDPTKILVKILSAPTVRQRNFRTAQLATHKNSSLQRTLCKYVPHDDLFAMLDDPFNTAKSDNILYTVQENFVDLYSNNKSLPLGVTIKYLRRPANVNINAGVGCELAEHTHHEIVEMTVKSILEAFESPRYQSQSGEVLESE